MDWSQFWTITGQSLIVLFLSLCVGVVVGAFVVSAIRQLRKKDQ